MHMLPVSQQNQRYLLVHLEIKKLLYPHLPSSAWQLGGAGGASYSLKALPTRSGQRLAITRFTPAIAATSTQHRAHADSEHVVPMVVPEQEPAPQGREETA